MEEKKGAKLVVKSKFNLLMELINRNVGTIIILLLLIYPAVKLNVIKPYVICMIIYAVYVVISTLIRMMRYQCSKYEFYSDRVVITDSFYKRIPNVIEYKDIKDVLIYQDYVQKFFGYGSIIIKINTNNILKKEIILPAIENVQNVAVDLNKVIYNS